MLAESEDGQAVELLAPYRKILAALNPQGPLRHYPGSPEIARHFLRPQDRLILNELHPDDNATLTARYCNNRNVRVTKLDATRTVKAELPFKERRGLVLIDPAFEVTDETIRVLHLIQQGLQRMANAVFLIWYPVTTQEFADSFCDMISTSGVPQASHLREQ